MEKVKMRIDLPMDINTYIQQIQAKHLIEKGKVISKQDVILNIIRQHYGKN